MVDDQELRGLEPYAGRWVALVNGRVFGVGWTSEEARLASKRSRPREEPRLLYVPVVEEAMDELDPTA